MNIRNTKTKGTCEACHRTTPEINIVTWERAGETYLLCEPCLKWAREVLELVDVKEAEA